MTNAMMSINNYCRNLLTSFSKLFKRNSSLSKGMNFDTNLPSVLICGLGNLDMPETRHSVGMKAVDHLALKLDTNWIKRSDLKAYMAVKTIEIPQEASIHGSGEEFVGSINIVLLKSTLPMNLNGKSVLKAAKYFNTKPENVFLVHDEMDKIVGKFSIKEGGSARGHNGVKSVTDYFQSDTTCRLLIGIDRPSDKSQVVDHVLSRWNSKESNIIERQMDESMKLLLKRIEKNLGKNYFGQLVQLVS